MSSRTAVAAIVLIGSVALASSAAVAQEPASMSACLHMSKKVSDALATSQDSPTYRVAQDERRNAQAFCSQGFYARGISSYEHALSDLGQGALSDLGHNRG